MVWNYELTFLLFSNTFNRFNAEMTIASKGAINDVRQLSVVAVKVACRELVVCQIVVGS